MCSYDIPELSHRYYGFGTSAVPTVAAARQILKPISNLQLTQSPFIIPSRRALSKSDNYNDRLLTPKLSYN